MNSISMSSIVKYAVLILVFLASSPVAHTQVIIDESQAREELAAKGVDEAELRAELLKKGIDIDNIDATDPASLQRTQKIIEETIAEIQARQEGVTADTIDQDDKANVILSNEEEIKEAIEDGATLEEAVNEELQEEAAEILPTAQVYGQHLFRNRSIKFYRKSEDAKPPSTYILGPGDEISVAIWGQAELNFSQEITRDGYIKPDRVARIYLSGLTIAEAKKIIKRKLANFYPFTDNTFDVNVVTARTINVNITGEVFNVGSYSVSALNTAFNALVAAGGPTDIGSVRNIKVASTSAGTRTLDLYKFMSEPLLGQDFYLFENDYIIVPVAEKVVEIRGAVKRPFRYELLKGESLNELIDFAGGLRADALKRSIKITRIENDLETILNVNLNELQRSNRNFELQNGDVVEVVVVPKAYENVVSINGSVELPGEYAFKKDMKISDLLEAAKVEDDAILTTAYLMRLNDDRTTVRYTVVDISQIQANKRSAENLLLERGDVVTVRSKSSFVEQKQITVEGAVRIAGTYPFSGAGLKVSDAIFLSGGLSDRATDFAFILRDDDGVEGNEYITVDLDKVLAGDSEANIDLLEGDRLVVYDKNQFLDESFISVSGAVRGPRDIRYDNTLDIKKALLLAGGLTFDASLEQIDIYRLDFSGDKKTRTLAAKISLDSEYNVVGSSADVDLQPFDQIIVRKAPEFELQRNITVRGEVRYPGQYALLADNSTISDAIRLSGGFTDEAFLGGATLFRPQDDVGFVIIDLEKAMSKKGKTFDAILQAGDEIVIPKKNNLVTVSGAVLAYEALTDAVASSGKYSFVHEPGKNAKYYVDKYAGGVSESGKASRITVRHPNGELRKTTKFMFFNNYPEVVPGSYIYVGYKDVKDPLAEGENEGIDWGEVLSDSVAQATTILTLVILINNLD